MWFCFEMQDNSDPNRSFSQFPTIYRVNKQGLFNDLFKFVIGDE
jgi:hypothetical protein